MNNNNPLNTTADLYKQLINATNLNTQAQNNLYKLFAQRDPKEEFVKGGNSGQFGNTSQNKASISIIMCNGLQTSGATELTTPWFDIANYNYHNFVLVAAADSAGTTPSVIIDLEQTIVGSATSSMYTNTVAGTAISQTIFTRSPLEQVRLHLTSFVSGRVSLYYKGYRV